MSNWIFFSLVRLSLITINVVKAAGVIRAKARIGHYLSANINGKTKNLYLNKEAVDQARLMTQSYSEVKTLLKQLSEVNYQLLREKKPGPRRRQAGQQSRLGKSSDVVIKPDESSADHQTLG